MLTRLCFVILVSAFSSNVFAEKPKVIMYCIDRCVPCRLVKSHTKKIMDSDIDVEWIDHTKAPYFKTYPVIRYVVNGQRLPDDIGFQTARHIIAKASRR